MLNQFLTSEIILIELQVFQAPVASAAKWVQQHRPCIQVVRGNRIEMPGLPTTSTDNLKQRTIKSTHTPSSGWRETVVPQRLRPPMQTNFPCMMFFREIQLDTPRPPTTTTDIPPGASVDRKVAERDAASPICKPVGWRETTNSVFCR